MAGTKGQWNETGKRGYFLGALWTTFDVKPEKSSTYVGYNQTMPLPGCRKNLE